MNKHRTISKLFLATAGIAAALWFLLSPKQGAQTAASPSPASVSGSSNSATLTTPTSSLRSTSEPWPKMQYQGMSDPRWPEMRRREKVDPSWEWEIPINFYGKVVDENLVPISGARAYFQWSDLSKNGASDTEKLSDGNGLFELTGVKGKIVTVRVSKDGYYQTKSSRAVNFEFADFSSSEYYEPDPNSPVIFQLRKKGFGEPLISGRVKVSVPSDGTPVRVDFLNKGLLSASGQLQISAVTNTEKYPPRFFDWNANLSVPSGGLLEQNDEFPFKAPLGGYVSQVQFNFPASDPATWKRVVNQSYYFTFGAPKKYGRLTIEINGGSQHVDIQYWINPNGSQDLEPAP